MRINNLEQFIKLRRELTQEKEQITRRLAQINDALGEMPPAPSSSAEPAAKAPRAQAPGQRGGGGGGSLREQVLAVLREGPKTKEEVLEAVRRRGYKFQTNNPLNSLGVILYGKNPKLNRVDGRFSLGSGGAGKSTGAASGGKRQMSAAARQRIAEAQRKRWAATKKTPAASSATPAAQKPASGGGAGKRQLSPAGRKAIADAARKRWAAVKAAGQNKL